MEKRQLLLSFLPIANLLYDFFALGPSRVEKKPKPIHTVLRNFCRGAVVVCYHVPPRESLADWKYDFLFLANLARYPPLKLPMFWGYS